MKKLLLKIYRIVTDRIMNWMDSKIDKKICGLSLVPYVPSIFRDDEKGEGGTGTQSTHYAFLGQMFSDFALTEDDVFMDVGCGKGRIFAHLLRTKCPCRMYGIEYNEEVGKIAQDWTQPYEQIQIIIGDALTHDYNPYTALALARPFLQVNFRVFVEHLEEHMTHPIRMIFFYGQESYFDLTDRPGWERQMQHRIRHGLLLKHRVYYSIWSYDPGKRRSNDTRGEQES